MDKLDIESHPFEPFLPRHAKVLMLGSFPPPRNRWAMEFYYPNKTNDMWRIFGIVFFGDKGKFLTTSGYDEAAIRRFAGDFGIALYDSAVEIRRGKGNASDKFLEVVKPVDLNGILSQLPDCRNVVTTGEKAAGIIAGLTGTKVPATNDAVCFDMNGERYFHHRMVSSSRAYPLAVEKKAVAYDKLFRQIGLK